MLHWIIFAAVIGTLFTIDLLGVGLKSKVPTLKESAIRIGTFVVIALGFGAFVWLDQGATKGLEYFTVYSLEMSLSFDNVFVMSLIFGALSIPSQYRCRVLFWGILGAMVFRGIFIGAGTAIVSSFSWVLILFGAFLVYSGMKSFFINEEEDIDIENNKVLKLLRRFVPITDKLSGGRFFSYKSTLKEGEFPRCDVKSFERAATPLFVALVLIEVADLIFAVDSIPASFAVTTDPFIVYTANIFAILGLRSLFFLLEDAMGRFEYLGKALSFVLTFIGAKILFMFVAVHIPTVASLGVVLAFLLGGIAFSWFKTKQGA